MKIAIIIPAYNEEARIGKTLQEYSSFFRKRLNFKIIAVLNNCKDNTLEIVKEYEQKFKEIEHLEFKRGGKGFAVIEGFKKAIRENFDMIGFVDADLATPPEAFYELVKNIKEYDGIIASRKMKGSVVIERKSIIRDIYSFGFNILTRALFFLNYKDTQCGAKLFKKEALKKVINDLNISGWAFDVDLLYKMKRNKLRIKENKTHWISREGSKITLKSPFQMFYEMLKLRINNL